MKRILLLSCLATFITLGAQAQNPNRVKKPERSQQQGVQTWTQEQCDQMLETLDAKEKAIRSNPEELKTAEESGWFENAERTRKEILARLEELNKQ